MRCKTNRGRTAGPVLIPGYRRITSRVCGTGVRREPGEINDHPFAARRATEFGLSPSQMKGAFGNEGALPLLLVARYAIRDAGSVRLLEVRLPTL